MMERSFEHDPETGWAARLVRAVQVLLCALGAACEPVAPTSDAGVVATPNGELRGAFQIDLVAPTGDTPGFTSVFGKIFDGPSPEAVIWELADQEGDCQLLTPRLPFCAAPCGGSALCVEDDTCQDYPASLSAGAVQVDGLQTSAGSSSFTMEPIADNYQRPAGTSLVYPAFAEGDEITLSAAGSEEAAAFTLSARGISPFVLLSQDIIIEDDQPVSLSWTPPALDGIARVSVRLNISHHGGTMGKIQCDTEDKGSIVLHARLVDGLKALGFSGFPTVVIGRSTQGAVAPSIGLLELMVGSSVEHGVQIPGLVSCNSDEDCPAEQTCQQDRSCG